MLTSGPPSGCGVHVSARRSHVILGKLLQCIALYFSHGKNEENNPSLCEGEEAQIKCKEIACAHMWGVHGDLHVGVKFSSS